MAIFLRNLIRLSSSLTIFRKNVKLRINLGSGNKRYIMMSHRRLEKVLEDLHKNPFFDKYAEKIAKLQKTSPEEFLQRVENQEKKVSVHQARTWHARSLWTFPFFKIKPQMTGAYIRKHHFSDNAAEKMYITTPIFYANSGPHIGHLYTAVLADTIARFNSMLGHSVVLSTGTDEHGTKVMKAASRNKMNTSTHCDKISGMFAEMCRTFDVQYSQFVRTTEMRHVQAVRHFWECLNKKGHIYYGTYSGWYSVTDEAFLSQTEIIEKTNDKGNMIRVAADSGNPVEWTKEKTYKFRLTSFQDDLKYWLKDENTVRPAKYHKSLLTWIEQGLQDLSISRPIRRVPWAIPTPSDKLHTVYVWLDALVNYLTSVGYPNSSFKQFWPPIHVIGKDILKFHGIYWPAFLMAVGLEPPKQLLCHGHWTIDNMKISKSTGNVISPFDVVNQYTSEGLRYFLLREAVPHSDANYNSQKIVEILNADLANNIGNLLSRCSSRVINPQNLIPDCVNYKDILKSTDATKNIKILEEIGDETKQFYEECNCHKVVMSTMELIRVANAMFTHHKPWDLRKSPSGIMEMEAVISLSMESVRVACLILHPIIPGLTTNLLDSFRIPLDKRTWEDTKPLHITKSFNRKTRRLIAPNVYFFKRLNIQEA